MAVKSLQTIDGYFLPNEHNSDEDESDEDEQIDDEGVMDFSDPDIFSGASAHVQGNTLKRKMFVFKEYGTRKVFTVFGWLHFSEPWWAATIHIQRSRNLKKQMVGYPAYRPRKDEDVIKDRIVLLLMKACNVHEQHVEAFCNFLRCHGLENQLDIDNSLDLLDRFGTVSQENHEISENIKKHITSGPGAFLWQSQELGDVFSYLPQLLPRHFKRIIQFYFKKLPALQNSLQNQPWIFAFAKMLGAKHKLFGCEAQLPAIYESGLIDKFPQEVKDSLHIYHVLKEISRSGGHTFTNRTWLPTCAKFNDYKVKNWPDALEFLEKNNIILQENMNGKDRVYLMKEWVAESGIADGVQRLFEMHQQEPWTFDLDVECSSFEQIRGDSDQLCACKLISMQPMVILSGRGGCGKTTVVSAVFKQAEKLIQNQNIKQFQMQMFAENDVDDLTLTQMAHEVEQSILESQPGGGDKPEQTVPKLIELGLDRLKAFSAMQDYDPLTLDSENDAHGSSHYHGQSDQDSPRNDDFPIILLTAPTGKAANHLGKKSHLPSFTLHHVIYSYWKWKISDDEGSKTKWKFSKVQALVVDECSLVSVSTFHAMFSALLQEAPLKKVVLLGDINQLPSIEPGNFLSDLYKSLSICGCSALLTQNHRSEAQLIVDNAGLIAEQKIPIVNPDRHFHVMQLDELSNVDECDDLSVVQDMAIRKLLNSNNPDLHGQKMSQFVAFRRRDCNAINEICCKFYSGHTMKNSKNKLDFRPGDKVCCTKNVEVIDELIHQDHMLNLSKGASVEGKDMNLIDPSHTAPVKGSNGKCKLPGKMKQPKRRLCNGEIFFIKADVTLSEAGKAKRILTLEDEAGKLVSVDYRILKYSCRLTHAWARTIHTYQGSESDTVIYVVGSPGGQTWQHVYTAVTRGKKQVVLVTRWSHLEQAISRKPHYRYSSLQERVTTFLQNTVSQADPRNDKVSQFEPQLSPMTNDMKSCTTITKISNKQSCKANLFPCAISSEVNNFSSTSLHKDTTGSCLSGNKASLSIHDSEVFSDWDEDIVADLSEMESTFHSNATEIKSISNDNNRDRCSSEISEGCKPVSVTASEQQEQWANVFPQLDSHHYDVLKDINESAAHTVDGITNIKTTGNSTPKFNEASTSSGSPKRPHYPVVYSRHKSRRQDYEPVLSSDVSPLRRGLLDINILESDEPIEHSHQSNRL